MTTTIPFEDHSQGQPPESTADDATAFTPATMAQAPILWRKIAFAASLAVVPVGAGWLVGRRRGLMAGLIAGGATAAVMLGAGFQLQRLFTEEPAYVVEQRIGKLELRACPARVEAHTQIEGTSFEEALDDGFHRLAAYIFGGNRAHESLRMSAPVSARGEKLAMTSPVIATDHDGVFTLAFMMPSGRTLASLPKPNHKDVHLREIPERRVAVLRFSGRFSASNVAAAERELLRLVTDNDLTPIGKPTFAGFDPPMTLPLLRRNEVWIEIEPLS